MATDEQIEAICEKMNEYDWLPDWDGDYRACPECGYGGLEEDRREEMRNHIREEVKGFLKAAGL